MKSKNNTLLMTRCDYDAVFYRVFCVTLLAIAFAFTIILTNVFVDIDGLLANKHIEQTNENNDNKQSIIPDELTSEATDTDEVNYGENNLSYRTKRAIETQSFLFHIKNPKVKNILVNRLSTLLEELDAEESVGIKTTERVVTTALPKDVELLDLAKETGDGKKKKLEKNNDMLHLTMHNILLRGIIGHMDLNDVYKKVQTLITNFSLPRDKKDIPKSKPSGESDVYEHSTVTPERIENKFFEEIVNCKDLHKEINQATVKAEVKRTSPVKATPSVLIKTIIDIKSTDSSKPLENETKKLEENVKGTIEIIYNGKKIEFSRPDNKITPIPQQKLTPVNNKPEHKELNAITSKTTTTKDKIDYRKIPKPYWDKFIEEYFKHFPTKDISTEIQGNFETKRLKRHIKIKYENDDGTHNKNPKKKKTEDDELYVEIETHFDSKGMKGEKKKKLIRSLIEKIQNAIHSDMDGKRPKGKDKHKTKHRQIHFRKRLQNPLEHINHELMNKISNHPAAVVNRQLYPISKVIIPAQESSPFIGSKSGDEWKKAVSGPAFLAATKSINSAEMSELDVNYSKVLDLTGISQRQQKPLNTEYSEETVKTNSYYDVGKMNFLMKDIDGSGFSVGFNQYVDEPPDSDTMKLFTGLEDVIKTYHQNYDPTDTVSTTEATANIEEKTDDASTPTNDHIIVRRSVNKKQDYHSNEYKIIFDKNFMPYKSYRDIFQTKKSKTNIEFTSKKHINELPLILDENIFKKNLKPAEIFGLANLFERKKRSINVKKISNLKSKIKLNRYLNTKAMSTKRIFLNKKRNKRQINKIRIIASDLPNMSKHSDENIFVVSDENVFADRAIVKEVEASETDHDKHEEAEYIPYQTDDNIPPTYVTKIFDGRSRHNPLMSKYPHIFMEEISRSREEYIPDNALLFGKLPGLSKLNHNLDNAKIDDKVIVEEHISTPPNATELPKPQKEHEALSTLMDGQPKTNYKVTVKIVPKNMTGLNSGFKEIHTSINKRFNKNGLMYSSLVNVSEISKVVKINRTKDMDNRATDPYLAKKIKDQQEKMQHLLKEHAKHISEQLSRLNEEKTNLESIIDSDNITDFHFPDYEDLIMPPSKPPKVGNQKKKKGHDMEKIGDDISTEIEVITTTRKSTETTTVSTTTTTTTVAPIVAETTTPGTFTDKIKNNIISTIERNGNLTDQILRKIDRNTEILQQFLRKLTEKIQMPTTEEPTTIKAEEEVNVPKFDINSFPIDWANQFNQNVVIRRNDSHISIPFVYAYQQPMPAHKTNGASPSVANIVYHGHIHTNTIHPKNPITSAEKNKVNVVTKLSDTNNNQTRFFIDELENDYKVIQVGDVKKNQDYNMVHINNTTI